MERRAEFAVKRGVRLVTWVVLLMLRLVSRNRMNQVSGLVMSCVASIVRLMAQESQLMKGYSQLREAEKTRT
jgi:hypothetical protein